MAESDRKIGYWRRGNQEIRDQNIGGILYINVTQSTRPQHHMELVPDYTPPPQKKNSVELNTELSDIVVLLSGTNYLLQFIL